MTNSADTFNCEGCRRRGACADGNEYSEKDPFRFKEYTSMAFDFCPFKLQSDPEFILYYSRVWALQYGIDTFGDTISYDELDGLLLLTSTRARLIEGRYTEFWAKAFGGKK